MQTVRIEVNNVHALKMLEELEALNLIRIVRQPVLKEKKKKLSERLAGSVSAKDAKSLRNELAEMRK